MAGSRHSRKKKRRETRPSLTDEEHVQLQMLLDRLAAQDPEGESFSRFLESLKPLLSSSRPFAVSFIEALGALANPAAVKALTVFQEMPLEKPLRRAVKTALFRLNRQGLVQHETQAEGEPRVLVPRPAGRRAEAWASWPEEGGERGVVLKLPDTGQGYLVAVAVLGPEVGLQELQAMQTSRKGLRAVLTEITDGAPERLVEIPVSHLRFLLEEAAELHSLQQQDLPAEYDPIHKQLCTWVEAPAGPYVYEVLDAEEIRNDPVLLRASESLLECQPFNSWRLPDDVVSPAAARVRDLGHTRLVLSESTQLERMEQLILEAAMELFTPELRRRYSRLLEEAALLLCLEDRLPEARRALAAAIDLKHEMGRLSENTFVLGLVRHSIGADVVRSEPGDEHHRGEKTTESGLIIPG
jgi:hypothetical protein